MIYEITVRLSCSSDCDAVQKRKDLCTLLELHGIMLGNIHVTEVRKVVDSISMKDGF